METGISYCIFEMVTVWKWGFCLYFWIHRTCTRI